MGDLTKDFSRHEFACGCGCGFDTVDYELIVVVQDARDYVDDVINVSSGCRCPIHNKAVDGSENSMHLIAKAGDLQTADLLELYRYLEEKYDKYGIGLYSSWLHIDIRSIRTRW